LINSKKFTQKNLDHTGKRQTRNIFGNDDLLIIAPRSGIYIVNNKRSSNKKSLPPRTVGKAEGQAQMAQQRRWSPKANRNTYVHHKITKQQDDVVCTLDGGGVLRGTLARVFDGFLSGIFDSGHCELVFLRRLLRAFREPLERKDAWR